jgi:hypothetical protein
MDTIETLEAKLASADDQINELLAELEDIREIQMLQPFCSEMEKSLLLIMANTAPHNWCDHQRQVFEHVAANGYETAAAAWKRRVDVANS